MAELVLVRHGQASFGTDDYDKLSELGWRQSRWLGEYFRERGTAFDLVVRGSLRRHAETLTGIAEGMGRLLEGAAKRVLVVSSGGPIATILAEVLGMRPRGVVDLNLQTRNTGISELQAGASRIHCVSFNNVPHLERPERAGALTYS